jgi:hypothetical protein
MTIKDAVRKALTAFPGNKPFRAAVISLIAHPEGDYEERGISYLSGDQVSHALRDLPHVKRGFGKCRMKGRRVPSV